MTNRMSKITFRADDELIRRLEEFDASKSEVMREALRTYLDHQGGDRTTAEMTDTRGDGSIDDLVADRVDDIIADRLDGAFTPSRPQDINVNIALDGDSAANTAVDADPSRRKTDDASHERADRKTPDGDDENTGSEGRKTCSQCGENIVSGHVYCPNCGEKASHRVFCECGDELRSDWAFCPSCGRRTPAADVLDQP
jgi:Arc/MetJ-type ribon-helix-helix transcriptional regulator